MKTLFTLKKMRLLWSSFFILFLLSRSIQAQVHFSENFNGNTIPSTWAVTDGGEGACKWMIHAPGDISFEQVTMLNSNFLLVNSDSAGTGTIGDETITSPVISAPTGVGVFLEFAQYYRDYTSSTTDSAIVEVFNGSNWISIQNRSGANLGTGTQPAITKLNITQYVNAGLKIRFRYKGEYCFYWAVDNVRIFSPSANDVGVTAIQGLNGCGLPASFPVTIKISNFGGAAQTSIPVSYKVNNLPAVSETFTGNLGSGDSATYTFSAPFSVTPGTNYSFSAWTSLVGDAISSNDSVKNRVGRSAPGSFPIVEFTNYTGDNLSTTYTGWSEKTGLNPTGTSSAWLASNLEQTTFFGSTTAKINLYTTGKRDWLISPSVVPPANSVVKFKLAITQYLLTTSAIMGSDDSLKIKVSTNCGATWITLKSFSKNDNLTNQLTDYQVPVGQYSNTAILIGFYATEGSVDNPEDYDVHLDDIELVVPSPNDLRMLGLALPNLDCGVGNTLALQVRVFNNGTQPQSSIPVSYSVNGQTPVSETFTQTLAPGATGVFTFPTQLQFPTGGNYFISTWTSLPGDVNISNDSVKNVKLTKSSSSLALVNFDGYTGDNISTQFPGWREQTGLNPSGNISSWLSGSTLQSGALGNGATATINLYLGSKKEWLVSPGVIPVTGSVLKFKAAIMLFAATTTSPMGSDDSVNVMVSTNCGQSWTRLQSFNDNTATPLGNQFEEFSVSLSAYAGQNIILGFYATEGSVDDTEDYNFHLDDIEVTLPVPNDLKITSLILPNQECGAGNSLSIQVKVLNNGTQPQTSVPLNYSVNGQAAINQIFTQNLAPSASGTFTFTTPVSLTTSGDYFISVWTSLAGDQDLSNDSVKNAKVTKPNSTFTPVTFNGFTGGNLPTVFPGWKEQSGQNPTGTFSDWTNGPTLHTTALGNGTTAAINLSGTFQRDWLITKPVAPIVGTVVRFKAAVLASGNTNSSSMGSDDSVNVMVSANCGQTWTRLRSFNVTTPLSNQFASFVVPISAYAGQNVIIGFFATDGTVNDVADYFFHIDDVEVLLPSPNDIGVSALVLPPANCGLSPVFNLTVAVTNYGTQAQTGFSVSYQSNAQPLVSETFTSNLAPGATVNFTFSQALDLSGSEISKLATWTGLSGDANVSNDSSKTTLILPLSYMPLNNFESFNGDNLSSVYTGWGEASGASPTGNTSLWTVSSVSQTSAFGGNSARVGLFANVRKEWIITSIHAPLADSKLNLKVAVTNRSSASVDVMGSDDSLNVMASTNCGLTWTRLRSFTAANQLSNQLTNFEIPLTAYAGQKVQFGFLATEGVFDDNVDYDLHIDDLFMSINTAAVDLIGGKVSAYPNPAKDVIYLNLTDSPVQEGSIHMFSADGRSVDGQIEIRKEEDRTSVLVNRLSTGLYWLKMIQNGKMITQSVMVNR